MALRLEFPVVFYALIAATAAIPASLIDEIKSGEIRNNKVKRAHPVVNLLNAESNSNDHLPYFDRPTAIKRGIHQDPGNPRDFVGRNALPNVSSSLFRYPDGGAFDDDKTLGEYEKGYRYATGRESLDEALQNAVLKSELYGDPAAVNQYRYYGTDASKKRRRRDADKLRLQSRLKRQAELSPDDVVALLSLYEADRRHQRPVPPVPSPDDYRRPYGDGGADGNWLEAPVLPHADLYEPKYYYNDDANDVSEADGNAGTPWRGLKMKRRPSDPTRELRYLNGPSRSDFYTLSQLLSDQKSADSGPVYRRLVL